MRILILNWRDLAHPGAGGAEVYTEQVLRRWAAAGHEVTLFAAAVPGRPTVEHVDGYTVVRGGSRLGVYGQARRFWRLHGRGKFDVVIDETNTVPFFAHEWVDDGARTVALVHQTCEEIWMHQAPFPQAVVGRYALEPWWLRRLAKAPILTVSESSRDSLLRFGARNVTVVPEGSERVTVPAVAKEPTPTAVYCSRMVGYKRPHEVAAAVANARRQLPDLRVWMIGTGPALPKLKAAAPAGVEYLGWVSDAEKRERMARAHVHLATGLREGWGLVVTEAAALGTPTIAYDMPGLRDSTRAAGGVVVPPHPDALARWLVELLPRWQAFPPAPLAFGGAHSWDEVADTLLTEIDRHAA